MCGVVFIQGWIIDAVRTSEAARARNREKLRGYAGARRSGTQYDHHTYQTQYTRLEADRNRLEAMHVLAMGDIWQTHIDTNSFVVVVPTYERYGLARCGATSLLVHTLVLLLRGGMPAWQVRLWVADQAPQLYRQAIRSTESKGVAGACGDWGRVQIRAGIIGIRAQRAYICRAFSGWHTQRMHRL